MDYQIAVVLDRNGSIQQTAVLSNDSEGRTAGHFILGLIQPEIDQFSDRVRSVIRRQQQPN